VIDSTVVAVRSRPKLSVFFSKALALPGETLIVEARLKSRTRTPVEFVDFTLRGGETVPQLGGHFQRIGLYHRETPKVFEPGEHSFRVRFELPEGLPPSHRGVIAWVHYTLEMHVSIPWWPDVHGTFDVPIGLGEVAPPLSMPQSFCTSDTGGADGKLYMEAAIARTAVAPDEVIEGAVSFANVGNGKVRGVTVELVARESLIGPRLMQRELERYEVELVRGAPAEGSTVPFRLRLPAHARPSFTTSTFAVDWGMEIRVRCGFGDEDLKLWIPMRVVRSAPRSALRQGRILPVGRERRSAVWAEVSRRTGLTFDAEGEVLTGKAGEVTMSIHVVQGPEGQRTVATYGWPELGLELRVGASGWLAALLEESRTLGPRARFRMRARDLEQASAFLPADVGAVLDASFDDARIDDQGAELSSKSAAHTVPVLEAFATRAREMLATFARGHDAVRPPPSAAAHAEAWRAFAVRTSGRFEPGRVRVHGGRVGVDRFDAGLVWANKDSVSETFFHVALDPPLASPPSPEDPSLSPAARELLKSVLAEIPSVTLGTARFEWSEPGLVADPTAIEPRLELVARLARAVRGLEGHGPFR
jgi:hypothetical protein